MATTTMAKASQRPAPIREVKALLDHHMGAIQSCIPRHLTPERMIKIAIQSIQRTPAVLKCTPESLVKCVVEASSLGLEIDSRGLAYIVPYGNKNQDGRTNATLIFGYKGLMELAYRSGRVANIYAETVCENDVFEFELGLSPVLRHVPDLENRGRLIAVYAVAKMKDADPVFVVLGKQDIEKIRKASKAGNSGPWSGWEEEMWKKTAIRRLCKYLPLSPEISRAISMDEAADAGIRQPLAEGIIDLPDEDTIETTAETKMEEPAWECPKESPDGGKLMATAKECGECNQKDGCPALPHEM